MASLVPFFLDKNCHLCYKLEENLQAGSDIDWTIITSLITNMFKKDFEHKSEMFLPFLAATAELLEKYYCTENLIFVEVLQLFSILTRPHVDTKSPLSVYNIYVPLEKLPRPCPEFQRYLVNPYKEVLLHADDTFDYVNFAITLSDEGWLQILLRFGALILPLHDDSYLTDLVRKVMRELFRRGYGKDVQRYREKLSGISNLRVFFVFRVLEIFGYMKRAPKSVDKLRQCITLLFSSIPEPHVSSEEVRGILIKLLGNTHEFDCLPEIVREFETQVPESREPSSPRSLKHLCRFQIRESLRIARSFPNGVRSFHLPKKLEDYILLKEKDPYPFFCRSLPSNWKKKFYFVNSRGKLINKYILYH